MYMHSFLLKHNSKSVRLLFPGSKGPNWSRASTQSVSRNGPFSSKMNRCSKNWRCQWPGFSILNLQSGQCVFDSRGNLNIELFKAPFSLSGSSIQKVRLRSKYIEWNEVASALHHVPFLSSCGWEMLWITHSWKANHWSKAHKVAAFDVPWCSMVLWSKLDS